MDTKTKTTELTRCSRCGEREANPEILCPLMVAAEYCRANVKTKTTLTEDVQKVREAISQMQHIISHGYSTKNFDTPDATEIRIARIETLLDCVAAYYRSALQKKKEQS